MSNVTHEPFPYGDEYKEDDGYYRYFTDSSYRKVRDLEDANENAKEICSTV